MSSHKPSKSKSLWSLGGYAPTRLARDVFHQTLANNLLGRASELAFEFLFSLFPSILFMVTLFGLFASHRAELQNDWLAYFGDFLPPDAFHLLRTTTAELTAHATGGMLTFGIVAALWFASGAVSSMISALNLAYGVRESRSWIKVRAITVGLTLLISGLLFAALLIVLAGSRAVGWIGMELRLEPVVVRVWVVAQWPAAVAFVLLSYSLIFFFGPDLKNRRWHLITPGSAFGGLLWLLISLGFRAYLHFFNTYTVFYGSLGAVMILLIWLYLAGLAFLIGGEINAQIERAPNGDPH